ncbi:hypothetical protein BWQ96_04096 [Gracilariopsis chorda]|uniref:Uncharacterized protein n=1 Tax=Gracilariopsis chorda TaxID=448386 RepID=A0A2V3IY79_9FLOR|nr:hypothetical protein BWQ96_04096 [Gracilariopsis chorda]|eukprot:PXF46090.1 hypothetical protein BWQ96_04096 [Gracilariopsis chorda]
MGGISGPLSGMKMLPAVTEVDVVTQSSNVIVDGLFVRSFIMDISPQTMEDFIALPDDKQRDIFVTLGVLFLSSFEQISRLIAERNPHNALSEYRVPPIIPQELTGLRPMEFYQIVNAQKKRLSFSIMPQEIVDIENCFVEFKDTLRRDSVVLQHLKYIKDSVKCANVFSESWKNILPRFTKLGDF